MSNHIADVYCGKKTHDHTSADSRSFILVFSLIDTLWRPS